MALQATQGIWMPAPPQWGIYLPAVTSTNLTASTHRLAWLGPVLTPNRGSKDIQTIGFLPGAITTTGSTMRVSLQNLDAATGIPYRPDGTQDQTVDFLASAVTASTWYQTGNLSANRTVTHGELLAVVIEFQSYSGSDAFAIQNMSSASSAGGNVGVVNYNGATWSKVNVSPNIILGFSDGSFGTLGAGSSPLASLSTDLVNTGTTPDEVALRFTVPFSCKVDAAWVTVAVNGASRNFDIVLYDGTTALATTTVDSEQVSSTSAGPHIVYFSEQTLSPSKVYYLAVKPLAASSNSVSFITVNDANHFQAFPGGTSWHYASRTDAGAWSATTTKRLIAGILISALDDGVSSGGACVIGG